ncbi:protein-methionine sulfoxide oxidase mical3b [Aplochiton taeniatus]
MEDEAAETESQAHALFDDFVQATTCRATLRAFGQLCEHLKLTHASAPKHTTQTLLYQTIKTRLNYWRANALWAKLDKRAAHQEYMKGRACANTTCVIIGAGPCGLRMAVELGLMGARVVLLEKRDAFSRNNVLHLWPFTIQDLRGLGAKKFYGKFCAGSIDHISIRQLQLMLLKVALLLGVEVHVNVEFKELVEPPEDQESQKGWRMQVHPKSHPVNQLQFDVVIGADGRRNTLPGFRRKEFRGKLAIAITANFKNRNTTAEAKVEEISGVAFIFNQRFFQELRQETGIDLENIVYYKDDTHYFVMTAKKQSLLEKGVILQDHADTEMLLSRGNVDQNALQEYAREAADFSTNHQLPSLDFAINHYGQPDVAMFDFTCMYASENAALIRQRRGHQLLVTIVGDSLLEPFWPMGTGIARGFLAALDSTWMIRSWAHGNAPLEVLAEREGLYRFLPQTNPENMNKNISVYTVDPATRYPNINPQLITPAQVKHLIDTGTDEDVGQVPRSPFSRLLQQESFSHSSKLLSWCQEQTQGYRGVAVNDLTTSWKSGLALCALIHHYRPHVIDFESLDETEVEQNTWLGMEVAEAEFGIPPVLTVEEMSSVGEPDSLSMVMYLSQFYQLLKDTLPPSDSQTQMPRDGRAGLITPASILSRLGYSPSHKRNPKERRDAWGKRRKTSRPYQDEEEDVAERSQDNETLEAGFVGSSSRSRVRHMADQFQAKFEDTSLSPSLSAAAGLRRQKYVKMYTGGVSSLAEQIVNQLQSQEELKEVPDKAEPAIRSLILGSSGASDVCFFCRKRVYVMERLSAEGLFFHRSCFQCDYCSTTLRVASYAYDAPRGRFYCQQHYDQRLSGGLAHRKRPAHPTSITSSDRMMSQRNSLASLTSSLHSYSSLETLISGADRRSSAASLIESQSGLAKRVRGTPERIELENYRVSVGKLEWELPEEPEVVPEETLANYNLSLLEKTNEGSSSESEAEGEEGPHLSDHVKASWREAVELHAQLRGVMEDEGEREEEGEVDEDNEDEEEDDDEEEEEDELLSSDEEELSHPSPTVNLSQPSCNFLMSGPLSAEVHLPDSTTPDTTTLDTFTEDTHSLPVTKTFTLTAQTITPCSIAPHSNTPTSTTPYTSSHTSSAVLPDDTFPVFTSPCSSTTSGCSPEMKMETRDEKESYEPSSSSGVGVNSGSTTSDSATQSTPSSPPQAQPFTVWERQTRPEKERGVEAPSVQHRFAHRPAPVPVVPVLVQTATALTRGSSGGSLGDQADPGAPLGDVSSEQMSRWLFRDQKSRTDREKEWKQKMERRREVEKGALCAGWEDTATPLSVETRATKSKAFGLGTRKLTESFTESLPPRLLNPLQGSLFAQLRSPRDTQPLNQKVCERGEARSIWKAVFSGHKKERKKRGGASLPGNTAGPVRAEQERKIAVKPRRDTEGRSWKEDSELAGSVIMQRCSLSPQTNKRVRIEKTRSKSSGQESSCATEVLEVVLCLNEASNLSVPETLFQRTAEEELDLRITRQVQKAARKQAKQEQLKRLHRAQTIQRQLEQVEEKQRQLEERGVAVEKALRGEADYWGDCDASEEPDLHLGGMAMQDNPALMQQWFKLVQQKNTLVRYESELMIFARELELEDRQSRLQQELRERMAVDDHLKKEEELEEERLILGEMLEVVEQRNALVCLLEEQRLQESQEDRDLQGVMLSRGLGLHWA